MSKRNKKPNKYVIDETHFIIQGNEVIDLSTGKSIVLSGKVLKFFFELNQLYKQQNHERLISAPSNDGHSIYLFYSNGKIKQKFESDKELFTYSKAIFAIYLDMLSNDRTYEEYVSTRRQRIEAMIVLIQRIISGELWDQNITDQLMASWTFRYPSGKQGDIDMFIADSFGKIQYLEDNWVKGFLSVEKKAEIELLAYSYSIASGSGEPIFNYLLQYYLPFRLRALSDLQLGQYHPLRNLGRCINSELEERVRKRRNQIYNQLVEQEKTTSKWYSEEQAYRIIKQLYNDSIFQYHAEWLGNQSLDIYIPSLHIGIEYQGKQHYRPIDFFGGEEGLKKRQQLDAQKRKKCMNQGIKLIEIRYNYPLSSESIQKLIDAALAESPLQSNY